MPNSATADQPAKNLELEEMLRIMDVATTLRQGREQAMAQLDVDETRSLLREKLLETARATGERVSEAEVDAAIRHYYQALHAFEAPPRSWRTALAHIYIRRFRILVFAMIAAVLTALIWWLFLSSEGLLSSEGRDRRQLAAAHAAVEIELRTLGGIELAPAAATALATLQANLERAATVASVESVRADITELRARVERAYEIRIASPTSGQSAFRLDFEDGAGKRINGHYVVVEAHDANGNRVKHPIRDANTGANHALHRWAELVPKAVFDRLAQDKRSDGMLDETAFATKYRGALAPTITLLGADGKPIESTRQLEEWPR